MCTLVPHASAMTVAAITDNTLAVFNLFPDIVVTIWRPRFFEGRLMLVTESS